MFIDKDKFENALLGHNCINKILEEFSQEYKKEFLGGKYQPYVDEIYIETGYLKMDIKTSYCGCCSDDSSYRSCPVEYLWDNNWIEKEKANLEQQEVEREAKVVARKIEDAKKFDERRKVKYLELKKEFES